MAVEIGTEVIKKRETEGDERLTSYLEDEVIKKRETEGDERLTSYLEDEVIKKRETEKTNREDKGLQLRTEKTR
uniref:Uncharacterized protein n=1 Tax=Cucumis melo TaxID=3656 RepID=A0A9I9DLJ0_CUCME